MINDKISRAEVLLDAIGDIDDRFIFEASAPTPAKATAPAFRRLAVLGISLALVFTLAISSLVAAMISRSLDKGAEDAPNENPPVSDQAPGLTPDGENSADGLQTTEISDALLALKGSTEELSVDIGQVDLLDKKARIIWKYSDEDSYRVLSISYLDLHDLNSMLSSRKDFKEIPADSENSGLEGIWISYGGIVVSPCLKDSAGNLGYGAPFDYDPELEPSTEFTELIISLIEENS